MLQIVWAYLKGLFGIRPARTVEDILQLTGNDGTFWTVKFIKRSNGQDRVMTGRRGVRKHRKGGSLPYDPNAKRLVGIWIPEEHRRDNDKDNGYRMIPVEGIYELRAHGRVWNVDNGLATDVTGE